MANAPQIQATNLRALDQNLQPICFVTEAYPDGLDILVMPPGGLQPLGAARMPKGWMVVAMPPGPLNNQLQAMIREAAARMSAAQSGQVRAPGIQ